MKRFYFKLSIHIILRTFLDSSWHRSPLYFSTRLNQLHYCNYRRHNNKKSIIHIHTSIIHNLSITRGANDSRSNWYFQDEYSPGAVRATFPTPELTVQGHTVIECTPCCSKQIVIYDLNIICLSSTIFSSLLL